METEAIARKKAELKKREDELKERDDVIEDLVQRFKEWSRLGSNPDTKPAVDEEMMGKLLKWPKDAEGAHDPGAEKEKKIQNLEVLVTDLSTSKALKEKASPDTDPLPTLTPISVQSTGGSSPSSSSSAPVPFVIRRGEGEANELPIPLIIRETARWEATRPFICFDTHSTRQLYRYTTNILEARRRRRQFFTTSPLCDSTQRSTQHLHRNTASILQLYDPELGQLT